MIAQLDDATCPNCQGQPEPKKVCWACRNTGRVEAWRVCPTCGQWVDGCMCPREPRVADSAKRRPGRPRPMLRPPPPTRPSPDPVTVITPSPQLEGGGIVFRGDPEPPAAEISCGISAPAEGVDERRPAHTIIPDPPGQPKARPCWLGVTLTACEMDEYSDNFHFCRRCGFVYHDRKDIDG